MSCPIKASAQAMLVNQILPKSASCIDYEVDEDLECEPLQEFFIQESGAAEIR